MTNRETLEQTALRIAENIFGKTGAYEIMPRCDWIEFASRLLAEWQGQEPWAYGVESSHSGDVVVRETFDDEETANVHCAMNGGVVVPLYAHPTAPVTAPVEPSLDSEGWSKNPEHWANKDPAAETPISKSFTKTLATIADLERELAAAREKDWKWDMEYAKLADDLAAKDAELSRLRASMEGRVLVPREQLQSVRNFLAGLKVPQTTADAGLLILIGGQILDSLDAMLAAAKGGKP